MRRSGPNPDVRPALLVVEDDAELRGSLALALEKGFRVSGAGSGREGLAKIEEEEFSVVLLDLGLPDLQGLEVLKRMRESDPEAEVVILTGLGEVKSAVEAMRLGAFDYLEKSASLEEVSVALGRAIERRGQRRQIAYLQGEVERIGTGNMVVGRSAEMRRVVAMADKVARLPATVFLEGETGTGKEVLAQYIHRRSDRSEGPFVAVNLAALPQDLVESILFGHERGAFTGAVRQKIGKFEVAHRGTLLLDEISEVSAGVQAKLLRVLQEREFERVGGNRRIRIDVRIIAATNRDVAEETRSGRFREDLYYRLHVLPIRLPPLRERRDDVEELARHFLHRYAREFHRPVRTITPEAIRCLARYPWPGNVRELEHVVERAVALAEGPSLEEADLPVEIQWSEGSEKGRPGGAGGPLHALREGFERKVLERTLEQSDWNQSRAAAALGIPRSTLRSKIRRLSVRKG